MTVGELQEMFDVLPLTVGFFGSMHCLGMCGPLVMAYSLHLTDGADGLARTGELSWSRASVYHLAFHGGRVLTYSLLGSVAAGLFRVFDVWDLLYNIKGGMTVVGGILLIAMGLVLLKVIPIPSLLLRLTTVPTAFFGRRIGPLLHSRSLGSKILLGMATGCIPCCLSWAMIVSAASTQNPIEGALSMFSFGLGTIPLLFFTGLSASVLSRKVRFLGEQAAALLVIGMGCVLVLRGVGTLG